MTKKESSFQLDAYLEEKKYLIEKYLSSLLESHEFTPKNLFDSMYYSLFAGGKRIRPILSIASAEAVGGTIQQALPIAAAIEMIHTYSLIHDDLPAMDDDDIRRGKPTNHKVFGEATAILAGDGLMTKAFTILSDFSLWSGVSADKILQINHELGEAAGATGMVGGQQLDIESEGKSLNFERLKMMHSRKTGALICASVRSGAIAGGSNSKQLKDLTLYGNNIGLAFQIADDILDVEGDLVQTGKSTGKDAIHRKNTYPSILGISKSKSFGNRLVREAISSLVQFDQKAVPLRVLAEYIIRRNN